MTEKAESSRLGKHPICGMGRPTTALAVPSPYHADSLIPCAGGMRSIWLAQRRSQHRLRHALCRG